MLSLDDILRMPVNPTPEHLQALGLLAPRAEPQPTPIIPPATIAAPLKGPEPKPGLPALKAPVSPEPRFEPMTPPEIANAPMPAPGTDELSRAMTAGAPHIPALTHKEKMALPLTSPGTAPGSANYWEAVLARREEEKSHPWGSPENRPGLLGKIGHVLGRIGNIGLTVAAPSAAMLIPGTELNKQLEEDIARRGLAGAQERESTEKTREIQRRNIESEIEQREKPEKVSPEAETYEYEKAHGKTPPEALATVKGAGKQPREGELPLGDHVPGINTMLLNRFQVLSPGQPLPAEYTLGPNATQNDYERVEKALQATENAKATQTQRGILNEMRRQTQALANQKRDQSEKAIEVAAQSLANGDLTSLRDIASLRGDQRLLVYARIKELNPKFDTASLNRKIKMMELYTTGKQGDQLQSFGTFLEHAGALSEVMDRLADSGFPITSPIMNTPINRLRQNVAGSPEYQKVLAALDPVQKEFESYLLNNRALYTEDRAAVDKIVNGDLSVRGLKAALQQMGHTVQARYNESDRRFRNTMGGKSIEELIGPMSDEALDAASLIGIQLGNPKKGIERPGPGGEQGGATAAPGGKSYTQFDVDAAIQAHPGTTAEQIEAAFKKKGWTKK